MSRSVAVTHIRQDSPPWRNPAMVAECGKPITTGPWMTRQEFAEVLAAWHEKIQAAQQVGDPRPDPKELGVCMNCRKKVRWYRTWHVDPVNVMLRYTERADVGITSGARSTPEWIAAVCELRALEDLVAANSELFEQLVDRHRAFLTFQLQSQRRS